MTPRERVLAALNHEDPDRIPIDLGATATTLDTDVYRNLLRDLKLSEEILCFYQSLVCPSETVLRRFQIDTRYVYSSMSRFNPNPPLQLVDAWGIKWNFKGNYYEMDPNGHPLAELKDPDELTGYHWPTPEDVAGGPGVLEKMITRGETLAQQDYAVVGGPHEMVVPGPLELAMFMRGHQAFFGDLVLRPKIALAIMEKATGIIVRLIQTYVRPLKDYLDVVVFGDDLGTQSGPMISLQTYRKYVKPLHKKIVEALRNSTRAKVILHTDGTVSPFIDDIAEIGVAGINPVQASAKDMDTRELKTRFGEIIAFWGAIDTQKVLPFGTEDEVRKEVRRRIEDLGRGGGYVLTSVQSIIPPTPSRNIIAMFDEATKYGSTFYATRSA